MTQHASTSTTATPLAGVAQDHQIAAGIEGLLERLWRLLTSMRFSLVLILILAGLTVVGTVIGQAQADTLANADARAEFLATASKQWYGSFVGILDPLQLFGVFRSPWFLSTAALLVASIIACSTQRAGGLWKTATKPNVAVGPAFFEHAPYRETLAFKQAPAEVADQLRSVLRRHHFRAVVVDDGALHVYADRNRWAPLGSLAGHLSLVVILLGALVGTVFGFRNSGFMIAEGSTEAVPTMAGTTIQLLSFKDAYDPVTGAPTDYASDVVVNRNGQEVARQVVRVNDPLHFDGLTFYQSFFGTAVVMKAADGQGKTLFDDGVPLGYGTQDGHSAGSFTVPGANLTVVLVGTTGTTDALVKPGQVRVELYDATTGNPVTQQSIDLGTATAVGGVTFTFEKETKFTGLSVAKDPGAPLVWLGSFLLVAGFALVFSFPHRRIWGRIAARPNGGAALSLASIGRNDTAQENEFTALVTDIRQAFHAQART